MIEAGLPLHPSVLPGSGQHSPATPRALNKGFLVDKCLYVCKHTGYH